MACERTDKKCQISYRKGYKRQRGERERRSRTGLLSSSTTFFLDHSDPTTLSSLLFLQHMKQTPHQWCYTYSSQQNLSPDIHRFTPSFSLGLCLNITLSETHLFIFTRAHLLILPWPNYRKSQHSLLPWSILFFLEYLPPSDIYLFM